MAKFDKVNKNVIDQIKKTSSEIANVLQIKNIHTNNLHDFLGNNESLNYTEDIEKSIDENGFTDPLEVTDFGNEEGHYTICSGHRRRKAGVNKGMDYFPSVIRHFSNELEMRNYILFGNAQRNTDQDPLLLCTRYKMHEQYLIDAGFKGSQREEIAKRLGISIQQADRYKTFNKIVLPIWDMVREEIVGMSSVLPMASHSAEEQTEILEIMNDCLKNDEKLTRDVCDKIIKGYRSGKKSYVEISQISIDEKIEPTITENPTPSEQATSTVSNEQQSVVIPINNDLFVESTGSEAQNSQTFETTVENSKQPLHLVTDNENSTHQTKKHDEPKQKTEEEIACEHSQSISKTINRLETLFAEPYGFENQDDARTMIKTMGTVVSMMLEEMRDIAKDYKQDSAFKTSVKQIYDSVEKIIKS